MPIQQRRSDSELSTPTQASSHHYHHQPQQQQVPFSATGTTTATNGINSTTAYTTTGGLMSAGVSQLHPSNSASPAVVVVHKDDSSPQGNTTHRELQPPPAHTTTSVTIQDDETKGKDEEYFIHRFRVPFYLGFNGMSSVGIVYANKVVFETYKFKYGTLLTLFHFIFTFLGLEVCRRMGVFERKDVNIRQVLPLCGAFCGFVALTNLSLVYNSVGFYQLMKVLTTPLIVVIQTVWYNESFTSKIKLSLMVTCIGVAIATATDTQANMTGTLVALSAVLVTCMYQIWVGTKQKDLQCNSFQLLYYQAPISALMLVPLTPIMDDLSSLNAMPSNGALGAIFLSCILAFLVNLSTFLVIGKTSPVTYNVLGHFKLTVILSMGFIFFGAPMEPKNLSGVVLTLSGVIWYTHLKQSKQ